MRHGSVVLAFLILGSAGWVPHLVAQQGSTQPTKAERRQAEAQLKAAENREEALKSLHDLRTELQPEIDRMAVQLLASSYTDPLVEGYLTAIGQSLVPKDAPASLSFSFRVLNDHRANALALPDGRIFVTSGLLMFVENEAQLAIVLGHEIAHVIEAHALEATRRNRKSNTRNKVIGVATGAALGGLIGGKKGGAGQAAAGAAAGAALGALISAGVNAILQGNYSREQEREADLIGTRIAMEGGFDPQAGVDLFQNLHRSYSRRGRRIRRSDPGGPVDNIKSSLAISMTLNGHPRANSRAASIRSLIAGDLRKQIEDMESTVGLSTGSGRFERMTSGLRRDASILLAERSDRYDLALSGLESVVDVRPNDPRLLWAMGRIYRLSGRTSEHLDKALGLLSRAIDADHRQLYPAIYRDLAYVHATRKDDFAEAAENLKKYVLQYIWKHGTYPSDLELVYDHLTLFGDPSWKAPISGETAPAVQTRSYTAQVWRTPAGDLGSAGSMVNLMMDTSR